MVLGFVFGWSLEVFAGWNGAMLFGLLGGMVAANFVPLGAGCSSGENEPR